MKDSNDNGHVRLKKPGWRERVEKVESEHDIVDRSEGHDLTVVLKELGL
jgi:hypothetical protein